MSDSVLAALPSSADAYIRHGWKLTPIPAGSKGPQHAGWNRPENALTAASALPPGYGLGLMHAYSGTMALDIDQWDAAESYLAERGVDLHGLYAAQNAVAIDSGRAGHGKLLYTMPAMILPSKKVMLPGDARHPFLEFRCATSNNLSVQDVLPPTIHPETRRPYQWGGLGDWTRLPTIPEGLLKVWVLLLEGDRERTIQSGEPIPCSWEEIRSALWKISPDCSRDEWIAVGMALHHAGHQSGQQHSAAALWDEWSATSALKYPGPREMETQWRAMRTDKLTHVTLGTLFHYAREAGWQRPPIDASSLFAAIEPPVEPSHAVKENLSAAVPVMPMHLWPAPLRALSEEMATGIGCDPVVPLVAGLGAACAAADARTRLELMPGYLVPPVLWLTTVGRPSDKKTPGSRPMMGVLKELELADRTRFEFARLEWEGKESEYSAKKKAFLESSASPEAMLGAALTAADVPVLPPQPVPLRLTVSDITSQKLVRHAAERPEGFLCYLDEMRAWAHKVCDPKGGEDRSAWVQAYEAAPYSYDRVGAGEIYCSNLAVSIFGNIQPGVLKEYIHQMTADGLLQRFIPFVLRQEMTQRGEPIPEYLSCRPIWENVVRLIFALQPQHYRLSLEGFVAYREFQLWYEQLKRDEVMLGAADQYMTAIGKIEGTAGRLILMFHLIESPFAPEVSADVVRRVLELVRSYIVPSLRYVLNEIGGLVTDTLSQWVQDYVIQHAGVATVISLQQLRRSARRQVEGMPLWQAEMRLIDALAPLEQARWIMRTEDQPNRHHVMWAINPAIGTLFADHRQKVIDARQRLKDAVVRGNRVGPIPRVPVVGFTGSDTID